MKKFRGPQIGSENLVELKHKKRKKSRNDLFYSNAVERPLNLLVYIKSVYCLHSMQGLSCCTIYVLEFYKSEEVKFRFCCYLY